MAWLIVSLVRSIANKVTNAVAIASIHTADESTIKEIWSYANKDNYIA